MSEFVRRSLAAIGRRRSHRLAAVRTHVVVPSLERSGIGFRVASIPEPEPSSMLLLCFGSLAVLGTRKGR
jgi:hypothetical protein